MSRHLTETQISRLCAGLELPPSAAGHLDECAGCRRRMAVFAAAAAGRREEQAASEPDWAATRAAILTRLGEVPAVASVNRWRTVRRALLAAAAVLALGVGLAVLTARPAPPQRLTDRSVEQVFAEVNATLASDPVPGFEALDPLVPDTDDLVQISESNAS